MVILKCEISQVWLEIFAPWFQSCWLLLFLGPLFFEFCGSFQPLSVQVLLSEGIKTSKVYFLIVVFLNVLFVLNFFKQSLFKFEMMVFCVLILSVSSDFLLLKGISYRFKIPDLLHFVFQLFFDILLLFPKSIMFRPVIVDS